MTKIPDKITFSEPVMSPTGPNAPYKLPPIDNVRNAVIDFLKRTAGVEQVNVTKMAVMDDERGTWEAEAEVWVPNATIKALGLPVQKEVLDCHPYLLRLDDQLNVVAYGLKDSVEE